MQTLTTHDIKISVETFYQQEHSRPKTGKYVFAYRITIENASKYTVQLISRHWYIWDSTCIVREVEGEGVIGKKPTLQPGDTHQYMSWSHLETDMGKMHGSYLFTRQSDGGIVEAFIPEFQLIAPFKDN